MPGTGKLYEVVFSGALNGQFVQNVLHAEIDIISGSPDPFSLASALAVNVASDWVPLYLTCLPESYIMSSVRTRGITPDASATATALIPLADAAGARAAEFSTYVEGPLITFPVTFTRPVLGKIFMPGVAEDDIEYGVLVPDLTGDLLSFATALITGGTFVGPTTGSYQYCVRKSDNSDWKIPAAGMVSPTIGTQRRRAKPLF